MDFVSFPNFNMFHRHQTLQLNLFMLVLVVDVQQKNTIRNNSKVFRIDRSISDARHLPVLAAVDAADEAAG